MTACGLLLNGCYVYSAFQGARVLEPGKVSVTPSAAFLSFHDNESDNMTNNFGVQGAVGLPANLNLGVRYEYMATVDNEYVDGYNYLDFNLKAALIKDVLAISIPVGFFYGEHIEEEESWQINPAVLISAPLMQNLNFNVSGRYLIFLDEDADNLLAFNTGFGIRVPNTGVEFMPEIGFLFNPGEDGNFFHYGLGIGFEF
jgi:hypothetical protein